MSGDLVVSGGAGSVDARFDDMLAVADVLDTSGDTLRDIALHVAAVAASADVVASAVLSPGTAARVEAQAVALTAGPGGLASLALRVEAHAVLLRTAVGGYRSVDAARAAAVDGAQNAVGFGLGLVVGTLPVAAGGTAVVAGGVAVTVLPALAGTALLADTAVRFGQNLVETAPPWPLTGFTVVAPRWLADAGSATADDVRRDVDAAAARGEDLLDATRTALPGLGAEATAGLQSTLFEHPGITDTLAGGSPGLVTGLSVSPLGVLFTALGGGPATGYEDAVARIRTVGNRFGVFEDGSAALRDAQDLPPAQIVPPSSVEALFRGIGSLGMPAGEDPQTGAHAGRVRVFQVAQPDGTSAWVVEIPGTQVWPLAPGTNPLDLAGNVNVMTDGTSTAAAGVRLALRDAMADAGVPPGQPVLLSGHSQGGIVAGSLAADPSFRSEFNVTAVVTGGAPVARFDIPDDVTVLSLEHTQDPVPRLDGRPNPATDNWVTVTRDVADAPRVEVGLPISAHNTAVYGETGRLVDASTDPSVRRVRDVLSPFLTGSTTSSDSRITRTGR